MRAALTILLLALAGCAATPQAEYPRDTEAKRFTVDPYAATIYVFRTDMRSDDEEEQDTVLHLDGRVIGGTLPGTYFRIDANAGTRTLHGYGYDVGGLKLEVRHGEIYFVELNVTNGHSHFRRVAPETAKARIARCCVLLENWATGQRPLLR